MLSRFLLGFSIVAGCGGEIASVSVPDASPADTGPAPPVDGGRPGPCGLGTIACGARCVDPAVDPKNCGGCGRVCGPNDLCSSGSCAPNCQVGYTLCGGDGGPPYCSNLQADAMNCGACGAPCGAANGTPSCNGGKCSIACSQGYADCDNDPSTGCEVDTESDANNCGMCGKGCQGGTCSNGACQPIVLASGQGGAFGIALDANNVYWTNLSSGEIRACAKSGCNNTPTTLASNQQTPYAVATDGSNVFWTSYQGAAVRFCAVGGCGGTPTTLAGNQTGALGVALDSSNVYWTNYTTGQVQQCAKSGCGGTPTTLATTSGAYFPASDGANVYWGAGNQVRRCAVGGCGGSPTTLASSSAFGVALDSTNVYWGGTNQVSKCALGGCGGNPTVLASPSFAYGIAVDSTSVYWTGYSSGVIEKCAISGCNGQPTQVAQSGGNPYMVAVDATWVYWTTYSGGNVLKAVK